MSASRVKGFGAWLREFFTFGRHSFGGSVQTSGLEYPSLEVVELSRELRLDEMAAENGAANIPRESQMMPDGQEAKVHQEILKRVGIAKARTSQRVHNLETSVKARQLAPAVKRCVEIPESFKRDLDERSTRLTANLVGVDNQLKELQHEVNEYRKRHGVERGPHMTPPEDRANAITGLVIFTLVQIVANAVLFGEGSDYGLSLGLILALVFAFFDILAHFNLGLQSARVQAFDWPNRLLGALAGLFSILTVSLVNLSMVHLRLVTRKSGVRGWEEWLPSIRDNPFGFTDFLSWGLLVVGGLCSLLALQSGWKWDEAIPLFKRNGRQITRLKEERQEYCDDLLSLKSKLQKTCEQELDEIDQRARNHVSVISDSMLMVQQVVSEYQTYCATARRTVETLIKTYRDYNVKHRTEPVPSFFGKPIAIDLHEQAEISIHSALAVKKQAESDHKELRKTLPLARKRLKELAEKSEAGGEGAER